MKRENNRRDFLRIAGAALVAASVPTILLGQKSDDARPSGGNNQKQMILFGGVSEPLPSMPGVFGQACFQFQMRANLDGSGGFATMSDVIFTEVNSHVRIHSGRYDLNDLYVFQGTVERSNSSELMGKAIIIKVQVLPDDNANLSLTIGDTPVQGMLLPAIQKVREAAAR